MNTASRSKSSRSKSHDKAEDTSRVEQATAAIGKGLTQGREYVEGQVVEHPTSSVALSFVLGAGVGVVVGAMLFDQRHRHRAQANDLLSRVTRAVSQAVSDAIPEQLKRS